jgi:polar amino acid transport system substrate-binding protein
MKRTATLLLAIVLTATALAGCGGTSDRALRISLAALGTRTTVANPAPPPPSCSDANLAALTANPAALTASLRPPASMPSPGAMPARSYMAVIKHHGALVVGVDQNTKLLAYFNPLDGRLEGFEIDLLHAVANAIFGNPDAIKFKAVTTAQRLAAVQDGSVDVVADAVTITCARKLLVDFSAVYYDAAQRVLVLKNSPARSIHDLGGKRVCATTGSTTIDNIAASRPKVIPYGVPQRTDCLVALQQGTVEAISSDDAILLGFKAQDPNVKLIGPSLSPQPYGMAINKAHPDFVSFVNGVLAQMRSDGAWRRSYQYWFGRLQPTPAPPTPHYLP